MKGLFLITDFDWFDFLRNRPGLDEINFWRPSDTRVPQSLKPGSPVVFKLKKSHGDWIVGWAVFVRHEALPAWLAWDSFGEKNGAASRDEMFRRIGALRRDSTFDPNGSSEIGCLMLSQPVFLSRERWITRPSDWPAQAVQGKTYDLSVGEGARVWRQLIDATPKWSDETGRPPVDEASYDRYALNWTRTRLGQATFRSVVTNAYGRACAVSGEHSLPVLEAAHIMPYSENGPSSIANGVLLRSDIHRLYDKGYVSIAPDKTLQVSQRLKADFNNGRIYYPYHGQPISVPQDPEDSPDPQFLRWHMENVFRG